MRAGRLAVLSVAVFARVARHRRLDRAHARRRFRSRPRPASSIGRFFYTGGGRRFPLVYLSNTLCCVLSPHASLLSLEHQIHETAVLYSY